MMAVLSLSSFLGRFAVFVDSVLCLTLTSDHPSNVVNKFELHVLTNVKCLSNERSMSRRRNLLKALFPVQD